jgi:cell wall assembly regulator SMI1
MAKNRPSIRAAWRRIDLCLVNNWPELMLRAGATQDEVHNAESIMKLRFPGAVRESFRIHDGSDLIQIVKYGHLLPLTVPTDVPRPRRALFRTVPEVWSAMKEMLDSGLFNYPGFVSEPNGPIKQDWWNKKWIPITDNFEGDHICVDMDPLDGGTVGQIIDWWHERGACELLAPGMGEWLAMIAKDLEEGSFVPPRPM